MVAGQSLRLVWSHLTDHKTASQGRVVLPYIFLVAVLNLGLGFGVAVYLKRRYRSTMETGSPWDADMLPGNVADAQPEQDVQSQLPDEAQPEKNLGEKAVGQLYAEVGQYHGRLAELDGQLRACMEAPEAAAIEACLDSLREATREYLEGRSAVSRILQELCEVQSEAAAIQNDIQPAIDRQDEQLARSGAVVEAFDGINGLEEGCQDMVSQISSLIGANLQLRDSLDQAIVDFGREEDRPEETDPATRSDALTGLLNRIGLEVSLREWWEKDPQRSRQLSVGLVDVDHLAQVNEQCGYKLGDQILSTLARLLKPENHGNGIVGRWSGQRFFFTFPDADAQFATDVLEQVRQTAEGTHFEYGQSDIQVTVSCGVAEVTATDSPEMLFARAEAALRQAKQDGCNRTFLHDGTSLTPVTPTDLSSEQKRITLEQTSADPEEPVASSA